ncbi:MAG: tetratricopeptide repeat protein [Rhodobacteraceae bacterium]|nr:tetratricopeptide repeat protein [Paracoccaceae bacterium]
MSDIFREVDEDIRKEKYNRLWDRFGPWVIGAAVLIVVATAGYRGWAYYERTQAQTAGDRFMHAVKLSEAGDFVGANQIYAELEEARGGYPVIARMRAASDLAKAGKPGEALGAFDEIANDSGVERALRDIASLRAAYLAVDSEPYTAIADRVEGLTGADNSFRSAAREVLALAAWKAGDIETARQWIAAIDNDPQTPSDVTGRIDVLEKVIVAAHGASQDGASEDGGEGEAQ